MFKSSFLVRFLIVKHRCYLFFDENMQIPVQIFFDGIDLWLFTDDSLGLDMQREGRTSNTASAITAYFQKVTVASQQETLGNVVAEILREWRSAQNYFIVRTMLLLTLRLNITTSLLSCFLKDKLGSNLMNLLKSVV